MSIFAFYPLVILGVCCGYPLVSIGETSLTGYRLSGLTLHNTAISLSEEGRGGSEGREEEKCGGPEDEDERPDMSRRVGLKKQSETLGENIEQSPLRDVENKCVAADEFDRSATVDETRQSDEQGRAGERQEHIKRPVSKCEIIVHHPVL